MALIDVLKRTKSYSAEKTKKVYSGLKNELNRRVGTRALYDYATQNSRFGRIIGDAFGIGKHEKPTKAKDNTEIKEKQEEKQTEEKRDNPQIEKAQSTQSNDNTQSGDMQGEKVYHKLVDIEQALTRMDTNQSQTQTHTQHILRDSISDLVKQSETTKIENNNQTDNNNKEIQSTAKETNNALIERIENESDDSVALEQAKDIHFIRESVDKMLKGNKSDGKHSAETPFKERLGHLVLDYLEQKDGFDIDIEKRDKKDKPKTDKPKQGRVSRMREAVNNRTEKFRNGIKNVASKTSTLGDKTKTFGRNMASRTGGMVKGAFHTLQNTGTTMGQAITSRLPTMASMGARTAPIMASAGSALSGTATSAGGAIAGAGGGTLAALAAALLFGGTGLYSAYKAIKGEDASNWISNIADKGVQGITGDKDATLGTALYDAIHGESNQSEKETIQSNNQNAIVTDKQETVNNNFTETKEKVSSETNNQSTVSKSETSDIRLEKAPFAIETKVSEPIGGITDNSENISKSENSIDNRNYELAPVSQLPTITEIAKGDTEKQQAIEQAQSNPKPVVIQPPTQTPSANIQGGGRSNQEQPPIITKPIDSTLRAIANQFIWNGV